MCAGFKLSPGCGITADVKDALLHRRLDVFKEEAMTSHAPYFENDVINRVNVHITNSQLILRPVMESIKQCMSVALMVEKGFFA